MHVTALQMAKLYWIKMRFSALREVQTKLTNFAKASESTKTYWLQVHEALERVSNEARRRAEANVQRKERVMQ